MKKILITGGSGFLGSRICQYYRQNLHGQYEILSPSHAEMDFTKMEGVQHYIDKNKPAMIIHCGAVSDTGYAQEHPEESFLINVVGTENLARISGEKGIRLIFMSSDQIYNGRTIMGQNYMEKADASKEEIDDCPVNEYGKQKKEAEIRSLKWNPDTVALRLTWLYDLPGEGVKTNKNLLTNLLNAKEQNSPLFFARHEYRGITNVWEVISNLEMVMTIPAGIYNYGSSNSLSTIDIARKAAEVVGVSQNLIREDGERFKERPRNLTMSTEKLEKAGIKIRATLEGIEYFGKSKRLE